MFSTIFSSKFGSNQPFRAMAAKSAAVKAGVFGPGAPNFPWEQV